MGRIEISLSQGVFLGFLGLLAVQRLFELRLSRQNEKWILERGGREHNPGHFFWMKLLHTSWFFAILLEVFWGQRQPKIYLAIPAFVAFLLGQALRYAAIRHLGRRWSVRIYTLPGEPPIRNGIFRILRHPNYLGVAIEIFAVPLLYSAWITSIAYSFLNGILLSYRIRKEEQALQQAANSAHQSNQIASNTSK